MKDYSDLIKKAISALYERTYYTPYPEHPKAYPAEANDSGKDAFSRMLNQNFEEFGIDTDEYIGEEVSPFWQIGLGVQYPKLSVNELISRAESVRSEWASASVNDRANVLVDSLERVKNRFFELAYATMHTTGQSFMMSFQASGPHANDRALEAIAMGVEELNRFPSEVEWVKPMGKFDLKLQKNWKAIPKGIGLVIGCSTFPTWNTVPGMYASLITGNPVIVKPHPKSILPIALVISELRKSLKEAGLNPDIIQMAVDTVSNPVTKELAEHKAISLIDYTGGNAFGDYVETIPGKTTFTEKAGINSVIIDSAKDMKAVAQNIGFSASLYSGQMCTAPQNIYVPAGGIQTDEGTVSFDEVVGHLEKAISGLVNHPKMGAGTLGAIQNSATLERAKQAGKLGDLVLDGIDVANPEFENARIASPRLVVVDAGDETYKEECFGPVLMVVRTKDTAESISIASRLAKEKGAITCLAFTTDEEVQRSIEIAMNNSFTPVSFNLSGAAFVNQHAAFSDFHVTGGNPAGNASFTNPEYINKRFVWVGNRYM
jgi:phenylacetic acid degradation protein paaN